METAGSAAPGMGDAALSEPCPGGAGSQDAGSAMGLGGNAVAPGGLAVPWVTILHAGCSLPFSFGSLFLAQVFSLPFLFAERGHQGVLTPLRGVPFGLFRAM